MGICGDKINLGNNLIDEAVNKLKKTLSKYTDFNYKAIILFSGGRDSSIVASTFCQAFPDSEPLLFFVNNGVLYNQMAAYKQYELIKRLYPKTNISFIEKSVLNIMNRAAMQEIENDFVKYNFSTLLVCIGCKLILTYAVMEYAKECNIKYILDGSSVRQNHFPEQTQTFIQERNKIFSDNGLYCISPLYDFLSNKEKIIKTLNSFGIPDKQEASCMFAYSFSEACEDDIRQYINKSIPIIKNAIAEQGGMII